MRINLKNRKNYTMREKISIIKRFTLNIIYFSFSNKRIKPLLIIYFFNYVQ